MGRRGATYKGRGLLLRETEGKRGDRKGSLADLGGARGPCPPEMPEVTSK